MDICNLKDKTAIVGIGWTKISQNSGVSVIHLAAEACKKAIDDAGLDVKDIDGVASFNMGDSVMPTHVACCLGLPRLGYHLEYWGGGPTSGQIIANAAMAIQAGLAKHVVCYRALNGRSGRRIGGTGERPEPRGQDQFLIPYGWTNFTHPCTSFARRHMIKYGTTPRQMGMVAVTERKYAVLNERAYLRKPITIEDYFNSKMISDPFRLLDICIEVDAAVAVVVTSAERAKSCKHRPVYIMGVGYGGGPNPTYYASNTSGLFELEEHSELFGKYVSPQLYQMAGVSPKDIDVAEMYDEMTITLIIQLEDFGFCKKGEGGPFVEEGNTALGGKLPTNTHGGLLSEGYIHGMSHIAEAVSQLRGDAGPRQVKDAELALTTSFGPSNGSALILRR